MKAETKKTIVMGLLCFVAGVLFGLYVSWSPTGRGQEFFPFYAGIAAFMTGAFFWWLMVVRPSRYKAGLGAAVGALAGIVAHYICWYVQIIAANICYWIFGGCVSSLGEPPVDPFNGLSGALYLSFFSLITIGWATALTGALIGAALAHKQALPSVTPS